MMHSISPSHIFIPATSAYLIVMHHLALRLPSILHASCMVSYKDNLYKLLLVQVMVVPTIHIFADSAQGSFGDMIDIGVPIQDELTTLRFRVDIAEAENASLRARIKTMEAVKKVTRNHERLARIEIEQELASVQDSHGQDQEDFRKLKEFVTK
ncbi:hypothetical protein Tco_0712278 [Tanacetum coccineum]